MWDCQRSLVSDRLGRPLHLGKVDAFLVHLVQRRKLAQTPHHIHNLRRHVIHLGLGVKAPQPKADRTVRQIVARAQSLQHVARLQCRRSASRTAGDRNIIDPHQQRFAFDVGKADIQTPRQAMLHAAVDINLVELRGDLLAQILAQGEQALGLLAHLLLRNFAGHAQTNNARNVQRPAAHAALVTASVHLRHQLHPRIAPPNVQRANALGPVNLVRRDRSQIHVVVDHVERNLACRLHRVRVEQHALLMTELSDFANRLQNADLIVRRHDRNQDRFAGHRVLQLVHVDQPVGLHRQIGHAESVFLQALAGIQHALVLGHLSDDVVALLAIHLGHALDRKVVAFGGAGGEHNLFRSRANQFGYLAASLFHRLLGHPTELMIAAGGVAINLAEVRQHRLKHPRIGPRSGMVVHINW